MSSNGGLRNRSQQQVRVSIFYYQCFIQLISKKIAKNYVLMSTLQDVSVLLSTLSTPQPFTNFWIPCAPNYSSVSKCLPSDFLGSLKAYNDSLLSNTYPIRSALFSRLIGRKNIDNSGGNYTVWPFVFEFWGPFLSLIVSFFTFSILMV